MHQVRYAHCEGYTDICFTDKNSYLTTGEDGDLRIWESFDDLDNQTIRIGDKCSAVAYKNDKIYVADDLNELKKYDLESKESEGVLTSFTLPITCISVNKSNTHLVCGSADFEIHLIDLKSLKSSLFTGHDAPILNICFDPLEKYFVSSSCDGTARFWSMQTLNTVKTLTNLHKKSNDFIDSESFCKIAWHKEGGLIAVPCEKEIHFYERESWILKFKIDLSVNSSDDFVASICYFSPDGRYILVATNTQMVYIHSIITKSLVYKYSYSKKTRICSLVWNPNNQNEIIFCDTNGYMGLIKPVIKDDLNESPSQEITEKTKSTNKKASKQSDEENLEMDDLLDLIDTDEKSNDSKESEEKTKKSSKSSKKNELKSPNKKRKRISEDEDEDMCTNIEEEIELNQEDEENSNDLESLEKLKEKTIKTVKKEILMLDDEENEKMNSDQVIIESRREVNYLQSSFQSSSSPLVLPERYMVWNSIGLITQYTKEGDESIDIEFHNATYHHTIHVKNQYGYTMADMSKEAIVMASPGKAIDEEVDSTILSALTSHSKLACILINSCDNNKEWTIDMPRKEYIKCICVSNCLIACLTSKRFLRVYGLAGTQKEIICFNGSPISMRAYDNIIFICYGSQQTPVINYSIYYIDDESNREAEHGVLPLSEDAKLEWLGFSDEGNPFYYDSNGYLYTKCVTVSKKNVWMPYSDLRFELKHKSDNYWLIGIAERNQMIKAIICRASKYPNVLPRPTLNMVNINLPFCELDSEKTKLEKDYWKNRISAINMRNYDCSNDNIDLDQEELDEKVDKFESSSREILMKLFMFSCKNNREQRAYEVASIMDTTALQLAIKYATKTRALVLAQNLNILAEKKATIEYEKQRRQLEIEQEKTNCYAYKTSTTTTDYMETQETTQIAGTNQNDDIIFESESQMDKSTSTIKATNTQQTASNTLDDSIKSCLTPTSIPLTTTRLNPFKTNSAMKTPLNDSSKSVINEIEEKMNKQSASKEKDQWKPSPLTKSKLTKSKVSSGTPNGTLNSFFGQK